MLHARLVRAEHEAYGAMIAIEAKPRSDAALYDAVATAQGEVEAPIEQRLDFRITEAKLRGAHESRLRQLANQSHEVHLCTVMYRGRVRGRRALNAGCVSAPAASRAQCANNPNLSR